MKSIITILLLSISTLLSAQNFEGTLTYKVDFTIAQKMIDMGVTLDVLKKRMEEEGSWVNTIETSIKNGYYKQLNESKDKSWVIYRPDINMLYTLQEGEASDICVIMDASMDTEFKMLGKMPGATPRGSCTITKIARMK